MNADKLAKAVRASIVGKAQGDFEYHLRALGRDPSSVYHANKAWEARLIIQDGDPDYMRRRLELFPEGD